MMGRTPYLNWLGQEGEADKAAVHLALEQTCLDTFADRQIAKLSGGEQQRVLLARALAQIHAGSATGRADQPSRSAASDQFVVSGQKLAREKQLAVLMALHDLNLVSFFADKVALLVNGEADSSGHPQKSSARNISALPTEPRSRLFRILSRARRSSSRKG